MSIIIYANGKEKTKSELLFKMVQSKVSNAHLEYLQHFEDLLERVNRLPRDIDAAVLYAQSAGQLTGLMALRDYLEGIRIILILPNRQKKTVSMGMNLYPRFIGYADDGFEDFGSILEKMFEEKKP